MAWYVICDALSIEELPSGDSNVGLHVLEDGMGTSVVPLFTSKERSRDFIEKWQFDGTSMKPFPMPLDIFVLGELLRQASEAEERHLVTVDPFVMGDDWKTLARLCSVEEFCLFLEKLHPVAKGLAAEGLAEFGDAPEQVEKNHGLGAAAAP